MPPHFTFGIPHFCTAPNYKDQRNFVEHFRIFAGFMLKNSLISCNCCPTITNFDVNILRVSGIYSMENNVLKKIKKKGIYVKEKKYFSRIRVEDLAIIIKKTFYSPRKSLILNASDDKPSTNIEVANYAAKLMSIKKLLPISISKFKNKMIKDFYKDSKKLSNKSMKNKLKIKLKFPTYKQGLKNIFDNYR